MMRFLNWLRFTFRTDGAAWTYCERCERPIRRTELVVMPSVALTVIRFANGESNTVPVHPLWCPECAAPTPSTQGPK